MRHGIMRRMFRAQVMAAPGLLPLPRPLMTGEVLDAAFRLFRAGLLSCLPYSAMMILLLYLPALWNIFAAESAFVPLATMFRGTYSPVGHLAVMAISVPLLGVILLRLDALARGHRPRFRAEAATALRRWPAALIATFGAFVIPVVLLWLGPAFSNGLSAEAVIFLAVPLFWPTALFVVSLPAFWCDRRGAIDAIVRSVVISAAKSWRMVGALLATLCVVAVFYTLAAVILAFLLPIFGRADLILIAAIEQLLYLVIGALGIPFVMAVLLVAHRDLELRALERRGVPA
jgi:hypothetical protein